jgi:two-component system chemotaxis response regulator CheB
MIGLGRNTVTSSWAGRRPVDCPRFASPAGGLPAELPASVFVAGPARCTQAPAVLLAILNRAGALPAKTAVDGERIERGQIYVAPPGHHLLLGAGVVRVTMGPRENGHRPANRSTVPQRRTRLRSSGARHGAVRRPR